MAQDVDILITCLPNPAASAAVLESEDGALAGFGPGKIWAEMSTTDKSEVLRLGEKVKAAGAEPVDCPVSGVPSCGNWQYRDIRRMRKKSV